MPKGLKTDHFCAARAWPSNELQRLEQAVVASSLPFSKRGDSAQLGKFNYYVDGSVPRVDSLCQLATIGELALANWRWYNSA